MANIKSFPNNQDIYIGAEYVMKWLHGRTSGVFGAADNAAVAPLTTPGMAVTVSDGNGWMSNSNGDGVVWWNDHEAVNTTKLQLAIDPADGVLNRIDRIITEWKTTNYVDLPEIKILKGTAGSQATAPALTNNSTVRQISLAQIDIAAGTTAITASMITDERLDPEVCGIVTENISVDTSVVNAQVSALIVMLREELKTIKEGSWPIIRSYAIALPSAEWSNNQQTVSVATVTADPLLSDVMASPDPRDENYAAYNENGIRLYAQLDGAVTFKCESVPDIDVTVNVMVKM